MVRTGANQITPRERIDFLEFDGLDEGKSGYSDEELLQLLKSLTKKGFFKTLQYDRAILCPSCGSKYVHTKYNCPKCNSYNLLKKVLIEHSFCGFIGVRERFRKEEELICPKCNSKLTYQYGLTVPKGKRAPKKKVMYRIIGTSFDCIKCGIRFERPNFSHFCIKCPQRFEYKTAKYESLLTFKITEKINEL